MSAALRLPDAADIALPVRETSLLHVLTCGSVDDGKSTLLGRLLFDSDAVLDDQLTALDRDSLRFGTQGSERDFALLVDGLSAEREQGITIDVAYRYFSTDRRAFIVADTPGHEQYTRNMATGASTAELAIILVDVRKGILPQTRRHSYIVSMLGVRHIVLAVNKMDLAGFAPDAYRKIVDDYRLAVAALGFLSIVAIPLCAREGDNVAERSARTPWYDGPALLDYLETVAISAASGGVGQVRFPVQWVNRPNADFRGYAGTVSNGKLSVGQQIKVLPSGHRSRIASIVTADGPLPVASAGQAVTVTLADEVDVSRGDVLVPAEDKLTAADRLTARVLWMAEEPLTAVHSLTIKLGTASANARIERLHHLIDVHSFEPRNATSLTMNEIALAEIAIDRPMVSEDYARDRELGAFVLIDRMTNQTVALGVVEAGPVSLRGHSATQSPDAAKPRLAWTATQDRRRVFAILLSPVLNAAALWGLLMALSDNATLATTVSLAQIVLRPVLDRLVGRGWLGGLFLPPTGLAAGLADRSPREADL
jgi:bifunctional enzyme CysN/CysC